MIIEIGVVLRDTILSGICYILMAQTVIRISIAYIMRMK